ncbi:MAG: hypothetical protein J7L11_05615 [Thermoprotei archaeon]|nr:hypothetical protein [Thermoprotei archaeon]
MTLITFVIPISPVISSKSMKSTSAKDILSTLEEELNITNIKDHVYFLSNLGSRVTGYKGFFSAVNYVISVLEKYGISYRIHTYEVVMPIDHGTFIEVNNKQFEAYALWPNYVNPCPTPPEGISGRLIYVGRGDLEDFDGKEVEGSIILMDFNSGDNWLNAARLGAKAVIFIEPSKTNFFEARKKFLNTPIYFPRIYVKQDVGFKLKQLAVNGTIITIKSHVRFEKVEAQNVIGFIKGTEGGLGSILIAARLDSFSVVPRISPSAHEAITSSLLLELARLLSKSPPKRDVYLLFLSGHWQAMAGVREFVEDFFFNKTTFNELKPSLFINLADFSPEAPAISLQITSDYAAIVPRQILIAPLQTIIHQILSEEALNDYLIRSVGRSTNEYVYEHLLTSLWGSEQQPFLLESEIMVALGCPAFSIMSALSYKSWWWTPTDDISSIDFKKLKPQLMIASYIVLSFTNGDYPLDICQPHRFTIHGPDEYSGFITLKGQVLCFDVNSSWYVSVPNAIVSVYVASNTFPFSRILALSDHNGKFTIHGIMPTPALAAETGRVYKIEAWVVNETTGVVEYAPDLGIYGESVVPSTFSTIEHPKIVSVVVMKCVPITVFDMLDTSRLRLPVMPDPAIPYRYWLNELPQLLPYDFNSKSQLLIYGSYFTGYEPVAMVFVPKNSRITISLVPPPQARTRWPFILFINATRENPEGDGILANKPITIYLSPYKAAWDLYYLSESRYESLAKFAVRSITAEKWLVMVKRRLDNALNAYKLRRYSVCYSESLAALALVQRLYSIEVMPLIEDSANSALFLFALFIVASLILERLFFHVEIGKFRLITTGLITAFMIFIFYLLHPALHVMQNSLMGLIGVIMVLLLIVTFSILGSRTEQLIRRIALETLGRHEVRSMQLELVTSVSPSLAVENMRRRRLRTTLVFLTVLVTMTGLVSLTSTSMYTISRLNTAPYEPSYEHILVKSGYAIPSYGGYISPQTILALQAIVGENFTVNPRIWYYPQSVPPTGVYAPISSAGGNKSIDIVTAIGLTSSETKLLQAKGFLVIGRPFSSEDVTAVILPLSVAKYLNVSVGDIVYFLDLKLHVVGIVHDALLEKYLDADGFTMTPVDPIMDASINRGVTPPPQQFIPKPVSWSRCVILPTRLARLMGGYIASVSILPNTNMSFEDVEEKAKEVSEYLQLSISLGWQGRSYSATTVRSYVALGWEQLLIVLLISSINLMSTIIGSVQERLRDVDTMAVLGLSPLGVSLMFIVETVVYAIPCACLGYFLGVLLNRVFLGTGILPSTFVMNATSTSVLITLTILITAVVLSAVYPAFAIAGKRVTPSLRRRWEIPTRPKGDLWEIPLMVRLTRVEELIGLLYFIKEYYEGAGAIHKSYVVKSVSNVDLRNLSLYLRVHLMPLELGIIQDVVISGRIMKGGANISVTLKRISGSKDIWFRRNYMFIDVLRKQILLWRTLSPDEQKKYIMKAEST